MAGDTDRIEQQIAQAREELANSLDALAERANPQRLADDAKSKITATLSKPTVKYALAGAGAVVVVLIVGKVIR